MDDSPWNTSEMMIPQALLFADADFTVVDVVREYTSFVGSFLIVGATAFYFLLLRPTFMPNMDAMRIAGRSAARIGVAGALLRLLTIGMTVTSAMLQKQLTLVAALTSKPSLIVGEIATVIALFAFASASFAWRAEIRRWALAGIATLVIALQGLVTTKPERMVNPLHVFAASMWIGTLFVMVVAGISTALSGAFATSDRGTAVALLVKRFTTLALLCTCLLLLTGATTAWLHLGTIEALWTSSYGKTLIVKLSLVFVVFVIGGYNNLRVKPTLGTQDAARRLKRTATFEIAVAAIVLIVTAVLVNLPAPAEHLAH
ncbi:MAG TPA: CopD family protein [Gemmatimonadaceae bacterium]|nr:CopD family protein [Gemmatimonadaceae bacterium]